MKQMVESSYNNQAIESIQFLETWFELEQNTIYEDILSPSLTLVNIS